MCLLHPMREAMIVDARTKQDMDLEREGKRAFSLGMNHLIFLTEIQNTRKCQRPSANSNETMGMNTLGCRKKEMES